MTDGDGLTSVLWLDKKSRPWKKSLRNREVWTGDSGSVPRLKWWRQGLCLVQCSSGWIVIMEPKSWALLWPVLGFPGGTNGKEPACQCRRHKRCGFYPWVTKIPWRRAWQPTLVENAWRMPWTEEPGGLQSTGSHSVRHNWSDLAAAWPAQIWGQLGTHWSIGFCMPSVNFLL